MFSETHPAVDIPFSLERATMARMRTVTVNALESLGEQTAWNRSEQLTIPQRVKTFCPTGFVNTNSLIVILTRINR